MGASADAGTGASAGAGAVVVTLSSSSGAAETTSVHNAVAFVSCATILLYASAGQFFTWFPLTFSLTVTNHALDK